MLSQSDELGLYWPEELVIEPYMDKSPPLVFGQTNGFTHVVTMAVEYTVRVTRGRGAHVGCVSVIVIPLKDDIVAEGEVRVLTVELDGLTGGE